MNDFWIILTGSLVAITCGLLGCFLVLRKMAMVGDAISHAVLPGIVIAFLLTGARESLPMLLGAASLGLLATFMIETFHRKGGLQTDASIGLTFTALFALGIILTSLYTGQIDLDTECILYGEIEFVPLDTLELADGRSLGPRAVWIMGSVLLLVIAFILLGYKELLLTTFDPAFASVIGISVTLWHYLLMSAVSLATVAAFESVGAILVVALLVAPPASAYLLSEKLSVMMGLTACFGLVISICGYYLAAWIDASIAGAMSTVAGILFTLVFLLSPSHGILTKGRRSGSAAASAVSGPAQPAATRPS